MCAYVHYVYTLVTFRHRGCIVRGCSN